LHPAFSSQKITFNSLAPSIADQQLLKT